MCGVSCALNLTQHGITDFVMISPEIGGRVKSSANGSVNYGAYYLRRDYHHVQRFAKAVRPMRLADVTLQLNDGRALPMAAMVWHQPWAVFRLMLEVLKFDRHYQRFKRMVPNHCQKKLIEADPYLHGMYLESALAWLERKKLTRLQNWIRPVVYGTALTTLEQVSALGIMECFLIARHPAFEFEIDWDEVTQPFASQILKDEVIKVERVAGIWHLATSAGTKLTSEQLVLATPIHVAARLLNTPFDLSGGVECRLWHLKGMRRPPYNRSHIFIFNDQSGDIIIAHQRDGTSLFFSRNASPVFERYFVQPETIYQTEWAPAFYMNPSLLPAEFGPGLILIGDHNVVGMEDCYLFGMYAANVLKHRLANTQVSDHRLLAAG